MSDTLSRARTEAKVSDVGFVLAAIGAGVGIYGLVTRTPDRAPTPTPPGTAARDPRLDVVVGPASVGLRGAF